jgi:hypothetical protein
MLHHARFNLIALVLFGATAYATTVYSNFGSGVGGSYAVYGTSIIGGTVTASAFTPSTGAQFGSVTISADYWGGTSAFIVELAADSGGLPGSVLESYSVSLPFFNGTSNPTPTAVDSTTFTALTAATQYWIVIAADPANTGGKAEWYMNGGGAGGGAQDSGGTWSTGNGPLIDVESALGTPEPSTIKLLGAGAAVLFALRKRLL